MDKISEFTVRRLSNYFRILLDLEKRGIPTVSSQRLAELGGITSAQVRKDLSYFGNFGTRGLGYSVAELKGAIMQILGLDNQWTMALFGAGSLGHALFFHQGFRDDGFFFKHVFDSDDKKVGTRWLDVDIEQQRTAEDVLRADPVAIGVIATPPEAAHEIAELLVRVGIRGILNFAPTQLAVPEGVSLRNVNLAVALESLSFYLSQ
ncbi:MAG TPA: redox-sensing transcriptional repressor Rex [Candidatus Krumholzibacteria bacterium]|nr:redox-sensing transcriptional repressor Rex [Candidatus Krumholzibacteria bacterium]